MVDRFPRTGLMALSRLGGLLCAALLCAPLPAGEVAPTGREKMLNPTLELGFEGCLPWSNGQGSEQVAQAPQMQLDQARRAQAESREYTAVEKYFQLVKRYPDSAQTVAALMESSDLLMDLGYPSKAAFCMDQLIRRNPSGTLAEYDVRLKLSRVVGRAAGSGGGRRLDLAIAISHLEGSIGLTLLEADRLGYTDQTPALCDFWPFSYIWSREDQNPFYNRQATLFPELHPLDRERQFSPSQWVPGQSSLRPFITYAYDAAYYAEAHLNTMLAYDPLSYNVFSGYFHRGRLKLERESFRSAITDFNRIQVNYGAAQWNLNYPDDAIEIAAFAKMYSAWGRLLQNPQPWKDVQEDEKARSELSGATKILNYSSLLQLMPVVDALTLQLDERLAERYLRMAAFYDRNGYPSAGELMRNQLRVQAPRTVEAAATLDLYPWRSAGTPAGADTAGLLGIAPPPPPQR